MIRDSQGTMLVSETDGGKVVALPDLDMDGQADRTVIILQGLKQPHGLALRCRDASVPNATSSDCLLYVAETGTLTSYRYDANTFKATTSEIVTTFPTGSGHFTRTLLLSPDGTKLFIAVGSSCNVCVETDLHRATVVSYDFKTKSVSVVATGLRNTVFMAIDPKTQEIWGTENGRDILGADIPPDKSTASRRGKIMVGPSVTVTMCTIRILIKRSISLILVHI